MASRARLFLCEPNSLMRPENSSSFTRLGRRGRLPYLADPNTWLLLLNRVSRPQHEFDFTFAIENNGLIQIDLFESDQSLVAGIG